MGPTCNATQTVPQEVHLDPTTPTTPGVSAAGGAEAIAVGVVVVVVSMTIVASSDVVVVVVAFVATDGSLLFANPAHKRSRVHMTIRRSVDGGIHWQAPLLVYPGPSGYSELAVLSDGDVLLLFENGVMSYSQRISLARLPGRVFTESDRAL